MSESNPEPSNNADAYIWKKLWFQWALGILVLLVLISVITPPIFSLIYSIRGVLVPMLIALGLAYVADPLVSKLEEKHKINRAISTGGILLTVVLIASITIALLTPLLVNQSISLFEDISTTYPQKVADWIETNGEELTSTEDEANGEELASTEQETSAETTSTEEATSDNILTQLNDPKQRKQALHTVTQWLSALEWGTVISGLSRTLDVGLGVVGSAISFSMYLMGATLITGFCFFFFSWKFHGILAWCVPFIPEIYRARTLEILTMMDDAVTGFIRGRIVQTIVMATVLSLGWWWAGVPYWLLLGVSAGALNLIPFAAFIVWPIAIFLAWLNAIGGENMTFMAVVVWPSVVYFFAQGLDAWAVEPVVQGKATDLDPLAVFLAVLVGGSIAGLLGMLLAIPFAACTKILMREIILPYMRQLAANGQAET